MIDNDLNKKPLGAKSSRVLGLFRKKINVPKLLDKLSSLESLKASQKDFAVIIEDLNAVRLKLEKSLADKDTKSSAEEQELALIQSSSLNKLIGNLLILKDTCSKFKINAGNLAVAHICKDVLEQIKLLQPLYSNSNAKKITEDIREKDAFKKELEDLAKQKQDAFKLIKSDEELFEEAVKKNILGNPLANIGRRKVLQLVFLSLIAGATVHGFEDLMQLYDKLFQKDFDPWSGIDNLINGKEPSIEVDFDEFDNQVNKEDDFNVLQGIATVLIISYLIIKTRLGSKMQFLQKSVPNSLKTLLRLIRTNIPIANKGNTNVQHTSTNAGYVEGQMPKGVSIADCKRMPKAMEDSKCWKSHGEKFISGLVSGDFLYVTGSYQYDGKKKKVRDISYPTNGDTESLFANIPKDELGEIKFKAFGDMELCPFGAKPILKSGNKFYFRSTDEDIYNLEKSSFIAVPLRKASQLLQKAVSQAKSVDDIATALDRYQEFDKYVLSSDLDALLDLIPYERNHITELLGISICGSSSDKLAYLLQSILPCGVAAGFRSDDEISLGQGHAKFIFKFDGKVYDYETTEKMRGDSLINKKIPRKHKKAIKKIIKKFYKANFDHSKIFAELRAYLEENIFQEEAYEKDGEKRHESSYRNIKESLWDEKGRVTYSRDSDNCYFSSLRSTMNPDYYNATVTLFNKYFRGDKQLMEGLSRRLNEMVTYYGGLSREERQLREKVVDYNRGQLYNATNMEYLYSRLLELVVNRNSEDVKLPEIIKIVKSEIFNQIGSPYHDLNIETIREKVRNEIVDALTSGLPRITIPYIDKNLAIDGSLNDSGIDFDRYRAYQAGDDVFKINWNYYARSDEYVVSMYQDQKQIKKLKPFICLDDFINEISIHESPRRNRTIIRSLVKLLAAMHSNLHKDTTRINSIGLYMFGGLIEEESFSTKIETLLQEFYRHSKVNPLILEEIILEIYRLSNNYTLFYPSNDSGTQFDNMFRHYDRPSADFFQDLAAKSLMQKSLPVVIADTRFTPRRGVNTGGVNFYYE